MGRLALVTGASSGIGEAYAARLAKDSWDLVLVARRRELLDGLARRLSDQYGVDVRTVVTDLSQRDELDRLAADAAEARVDLLVNNAALARYMPLVELAPESARELVDLNVLAPVVLTRAVLPAMVERGDGAIVNVASLLAFSGSWDAPHLPKRAVYASTKAFLLMFTQVLASELIDTGVRVQVLCPGVVRSEFHSRQGMDMSARPRMEPADVVAASLADLARGTIVSIPGADDETLLQTLQNVQEQLMPLVAVTELPARYST
jgi:short-subunit dehydrogenase